MCVQKFVVGPLSVFVCGGVGSLAVYVLISLCLLFLTGMEGDVFVLANLVSTDIFTLFDDRRSRSAAVLTIFYLLAADKPLIPVN